MQLFRQEVIDNQRTRLLGEVIIAQPLHLMLLTAILATAVLAGGASFLLFGNHAPRQEVRGSLTLTAGLVPVRALSQGVIDKINVDQGAFVTKGDPLVVIRKSPLNGDMSTGRDYVLKAPLDGTVTTINGRTGALAEEGEALLDIRSADDPLIAELVIPPHLAGSITPGQPVRLRYDLFADGERDVHAGTIERVSAGVYMSAQRIGSIQLDQPAYKASVNLDRQTITAFDQAMVLLPGMRLQAEIVANEKPLYETLLGPR